MQQTYDVLIIGGGPAGLTAGLYAGRAKMNTLILEKEKAGGQIVITNEVENYPGSVDEPSGPRIVSRMVEQVKSFGVEMTYDEVKDFDFDSDIKVIKGEKGEYHAKSVIIATGAKPRKLDCPGEKEFTGKGVSYCATCDAPFFEELPVYVIGGGDTAVEESLYISKFASKVYIVHRRDELRAAKSIQEKVFKNPKIEVIWDSVVKELSGDGLVERMVLTNVKTGEETEVLADPDDGTFGVFVMVGYLPETEIFKDKLTINQQGYIVADENTVTNIPGVFAAGDVRAKVLRQIVTATSDGAIAATMAEKYIEEHFED